MEVAEFDPHVNALWQKTQRADKALAYKRLWMQNYRGHGDKEKARAAKLIAAGRCLNCEIILHLQPGHDCTSPGNFSKD